MKIAFITNYYNHHQSALAEALDRITDHSFAFISTGKMRNDRKELGYGNWKEPEFVIDATENEQEKERAKSIINDSDVLIIGSAKDEFFLPYISDKKIVFRQSERPFKRKALYLRVPFLFFKWHHRYGGEKTYLLSASAYAYSDYKKLGLFRDKAFKWGYFPKAISYNIDDLMANKDTNKILWCGRMIEWKHPDSVIHLAERLRDAGLIFSVDMIGTGNMKDQLNDMISLRGLDDYVHLLGPMPPEDIRTHMERAGIFVFTSDCQEGWGAVVNEAMNSACAVVASKETGSAPFLIADKQDGRLYDFYDEKKLYEIVNELLCEQEKQKTMGIAAYKKIISEWNAEVAAQRLFNLIKTIQSSDVHRNIYSSGPCSDC